MKVYVVEQGSYSDRGVIGVCSTEELAKRLIELTEDSWAPGGYHEWTIDEIPPCPIGLLPWSVVMDRRGGVERVGRENIIDFKLVVYAFGRNNLMYFSMFARDKEHAIKIANEKRGILIAQNVWLSHKVDLIALKKWQGGE
jgi:hypothetical protein